MDVLSWGQQVNRTWVPLSISLAPPLQSIDSVHKGVSEPVSFFVVEGLLDRVISLTRAII